MNMEVKGVDGDGYCFLNAAVKVLSANYNEHISVEKAMQTVMKYLCSNFEKYMKYHYQRKEDMEPTLADTLIADVIDFFSSQNFNMNVVDLLSQITADVMHLDIIIYQNNNGQIQLVTGDDNPMRTIRLKFTHDNLHPQGNHYEAIVMKKKKSVQQIVKEKKEAFFRGPNNTPSTIDQMQEPIFIDLTDDNECISPPIRRRHHLSEENNSSTDQ